MDSQEQWQRFIQLRQYVGLTDEDCQRIFAAHSVVAPHFPALCADFYAEILRHPKAAAVITGGETQVNRLRQTLLSWLNEFFTGPYDVEYVQKHWQVGIRHVQIGLDQSYTQVAMSRLRTGILRILSESTEISNEALLATELAVAKMMDLDLALIQLAYEAELIRKQQQAERLVAIGQMGGGIAHELRNPLNVLQTSLYLLQHSQNMDSSKRDAHLERMLRQIKLANGTISALSEFTRLAIPNKKTVNLRTWLDETLRDNFPEKHHDIRRENLSHDLLIAIDENQMAIALRNLIANALEAMGEKGEVTVRITSDTPPLSKEKKLFIDVIDQGPGIPEDIKVRLTEPLFTTKTRGLGLGLALVRAIVERHGGTLKIHTTSPEGSVFRIELPLSNE